MLYRVIVNPTSSFVGNIRANTLFGAFCHVYSSMVSDEDFNRALQNVTFSNLFFDGALPIGVNNGNTVFTKNKDRVKHVCDCHNIISRNGSAKSSEGTYTEEVKFTDADMVFYMDTDISKDKITYIIEQMLKRGLGKRRNVGKGQFSLKEVSEVYLNYDTCKEVVALSEFIPSETTPTDFSEIGIIFRNGIKEDGQVQQSLCMLKTGTKFRYKTGLEVITGQLVYDEHSDSYVNARTILYPLEV